MDWGDERDRFRYSDTAEKCRLRLMPASEPWWSQVRAWVFRNWLEQVLHGIMEAIRGQR